MQDDTYKEPAQYASPPCFMHELSTEFRQEPGRPDAWSDVLRWRKAERKRLIGQRLSMASDERLARSNRIAGMLDLTIGRFSGRIIGTYWPFRGEPDLRNWGIRVIERGGRLALPVVIQQGWPLEYRIWSPRDPLERGVANVLVPSRGPAVQPDVVIAPVVGFDEDHYRLGYDGGFFDRTLAIMRRKPLAVGVGFVDANVATIYPQPHDIPMDGVVTD